MSKRDRGIAGRSRRKGLEGARDLLPRFFSIMRDPSQYELPLWLLLG
jgi:hypothetical protein